ncbi:tetratricopeptide repeat protein [candidate division WOR-3 bacterium]|nr:tetratricopeptide repeat protein [candidate division WOR-3 bacterium]
MILILTVIALTNPVSTADSLQTELAKEVRMSTIVAINQCLVQQGDYSGAVALLQTYERDVSWCDQATIHALIGDNLLYAGSLLAARAEFLTVVSRYTKSSAANDALERLYLLESARTDTTALKRLAHALSRIYTRQWKLAKDSLILLLDTRVGMQAYYYLALLYKNTGDIPLALGTLDALMHKFPGDLNLNVPLLRAELYILSQRPEQARVTLEDLIIQHPQSIHAVQARALLNSMERSNP